MHKARTRTNPKQNQTISRRSRMRRRNRQCMLASISNLLQVWRRWAFAEELYREPKKCEMSFFRRSQTVRVALKPAVRNVGDCFGMQQSHDGCCGTSKSRCPRHESHASNFSTERKFEVNLFLNWSWVVALACTTCWIHKICSWCKWNTPFPSRWLVVSPEARW